MQAIFGRQARRFGLGMEIPAGPMAFRFVQAHHLAMEYYNTCFTPEAHLLTHANHMERWHASGAAGH